MIDKPRLIEVAFPLQQASINSVHEKSVRHGHISSLHLWPARRPLAASRAALIAALLDDPGDPEERRQLLERLGGRVVKEGELLKQNDKQVVIDKEQTVGGVLHWGQETSPDIEYFRNKIHEKFGRAPRVLDPFAGGGAIPLEAMRMGCETTAVDINPVAWFILKCTIEYPQRLADKTHQLPVFATQNHDFMVQYYKAQGMTKHQIEKQLASQMNSQYLPGLQEPIKGNLAWHIRAWGLWVLEQAREEINSFYPEVGGKKTIAYLWARSIKCKNCRSDVPLLKTRWLSKKKNARTLIQLTANPNGKGIRIGLQTNVPKNNSQSDSELGAGTMSKAGATCPCCGVIMTMDDIRSEGRAQRMSAMPTVVVVQGNRTKEFRLPSSEELKAAASAEAMLEELFALIPFGLPLEPTPGPAGPRRNSSSLPIYGLYKWKDIYTPRQLLAIGTFIKHIRTLPVKLKTYQYPADWIESIVAYLACSIDRFADFSNSGTKWKLDATTINHSFGRYALPMTWDYAESNALGNAAGSFKLCYERISTSVDKLLKWDLGDVTPKVIRESAVTFIASDIDLVLTDPPYYDAIMYSDIMDFFYIWIRRTLYGLTEEFSHVFGESLAPKWDHLQSDGELIDDPTRFGNDGEKSKSTYEHGMFRAFQQSYEMLNPDGRLVVVFANKEPTAWEALLSAMIRAGFVVTGSWPIQTEQSSRMRAQNSAALSSSIWLVCRKRLRAARPGWDNNVILEMEEQIVQQLRDFWDAGIRGPDFVWAATGPALESFSKHPIVKKANEPNVLLTVSEFLDHVRRIVVDFVVGRVLSQNGSSDNMVHLDNVTNYYLLHRYDYGMGDIPVNAAILYAMSCNISDRELLNQYNILQTAKRSDVKLVPWQRRKNRKMGYQASGGRPAPLIDKVHRLMHLWKAGDLSAVDEYIDSQGLRLDALFSQLLQALIELAPASSDERAYLESISNHLGIATGQEVARLFKD